MRCANTPCRPRPSNLTNHSCNSSEVWYADRAAVQREIVASQRMVDRNRRDHRRVHCPPHARDHWCRLSTDALRRLILGRHLSPKEPGRQVQLPARRVHLGMGRPARRPAPSDRQRRRCRRAAALWLPRRNCTTAPAATSKTTTGMICSKWSRLKSGTKQYVQEVSRIADAP
jgi:hypothetical protein